MNCVCKGAPSEKNYEILSETAAYHQATGDANVLDLVSANCSPSLQIKVLWGDPTFSHMHCHNLKICDRVDKPHTAVFTSRTEIMVTPFTVQTLTNLISL